MRINKKRLILIIAVCAIVAAVAIRIFPAQTGNSKNVSVQLDVSSGTSYQLFAYDKNVLLVSGEGIRAFNTSGQESWKIPSANISPFVDIAGKYLLIGEQSGKSYSVYSGSRELYSGKPENNLTQAKLSGGGNTVLLSEEAGYKGLVTVQNRRGSEIFKWHSGEGYVMDAALSDDNRYLAISQLMTNKDKVSSRLIFFDINKNEQLAMVEQEDCLVADLRYQSGGWVAVSDTELIGFTKMGKQRYNVNFQGRTLTAVDISNPNNMVFAFLNSQNNTQLEMYDKNGKLRGSYAAAGELKNLSVQGEVILCSQLRTLMYIDPSGKLRKKENISHDIKSIQLFCDRKHVLVLGGTSAEIIKMR